MFTTLAMPAKLAMARAEIDRIALVPVSANRLIRLHDAPVAVAA